MDARRLESVPLLAGLAHGELRDLAVWMDEVDLPKGRELVTEGAYAHEFVIIESGTARVTIQGKPVNELGPGDFFGEIALLGTPQRTATVTTTAPMRAIVMTGGNFRAMTREKPQVAERLRAAMAERQQRQG